MKDIAKPIIASILLGLIIFSSTAYVDKVATESLSRDQIIEIKITNINEKLDKIDRNLEKVLERTKWFL